MIAEQIATVLERYPRAAREDLIPILQDIQEAQGYISREAVNHISKHLSLPTAKIYGVATFYNQFRFHAPGRYHIQVCRGTACHVKGSQKVLDFLRRELKIEPGQTDRTGLFSLEVVACVGACSLAPVICVNGEFHAGVTPDRAARILKNCRKEAEKAPAKEEANVHG